MNELKISGRCSHFEWTAFACSERTSLNQSTSSAINERTSNIQRNLHDESMMFTCNKRPVYNQWSTFINNDGYQTIIIIV